MNELGAALRVCRSSLVGVGIFSAFVNVLMLTGSMYMLEVYDRVIPSRSVPTLIGVSFLAAVLFAFQAGFDILRGRLLSRIASRLERDVASRAFDLHVRLPLRSKQGGDAALPLRDLEVVRSFVSSSGPTALFDLPWLPFYLAICFVFHPVIGLVASAGALILVALTIFTGAASKKSVEETVTLTARRSRFAETCRRNAEVLAAMGIAGRLRDRWLAIGGDLSVQLQRSNDVIGQLGVTGRVLRMILQSAVLGIGAYLVIQQEASAGIIIASSILTGRALAPVDLAIANWKGFTSARQAWRRLGEMLKAFPPEKNRTQLLVPTRKLAVERLGVTPPGVQRLVAQGITFNLGAGNALGVVGPSASGKSSLVRALVGVWPAAQGSIRFDGATLDQWSADDIGNFVGYLPQDVELIEGTIGQNIARFDPDADSEAIIEAAQIAGVHEMIVGLPDGYDMPIGEQGAALSAGQRQRIALARAAYGRPFLVVLDEPNSNLDVEGEQALKQAIKGLREIGCIVVVVAHRPSVLAAVDHVLVMARGAQQAFGPADEVLAKMGRGEAAPAGALKIVPQGAG